MMHLGISQDTEAPTIRIYFRTCSFPFLILSTSLLRLTSCQKPQWPCSYLAEIIFEAELLPWAVLSLLLLRPIPLVRLVAPG